MNKNSVWRWPYRPRYYLTHPWSWFKELFYNIRAAHDRATKGYCDLDVISFEMWVKRVFPDMLHEMAIHARSYPGVPPFEDHANWTSWLHRMAEQIERCQDEDCGNEYLEEYHKLLDKYWPESLNENIPELNEARDKYMKRWEEITNEQKKLFKETMYELLEYWDYLWE